MKFTSNFYTISAYESIQRLLYQSLRERGLSWLCLCTESVPVACSRVEALRCHGYTAEARRLAVAVARGIKYHQQRRLSSHNHARPMHSCYSSSGGSRSNAHRRG